MNKMMTLIMIAVSGAFLCGCVSYEYSGESVTPVTENVDVFSDSAKITKGYRVLGRAVVSGNYRDVTREKMMQTLTEKAEKCGADAILIVEQQVLPAGTVSRPMFDTAFDFNDTNRSWSQIERDVDITYGEINKNRPLNMRSVSTYRRIIRAEFLKYNPVLTSPKKTGK